MVLKLYNTRTRKKEEFRPLDPTNIRMYVCGPTVYDYAHIGNARPVIVFDVLYRLLRHLYGPDHVTYVRNITDVDDKINARAAEQYPDMPLNEAIRKVTEETAAQFHKDVAALGCLPPDQEPRATDYVEQMKDTIVQLHEADIAYEAEDHVLFSVAAYGRLEGVPAYGSLARRSLDEMIAGARVEIAPYKRDPMDFVLWKPSDEGEPGWPSPLNIRTPGRPGWHLECSAMSKALLGDQFDIHGGGIDLVFPHHENEIAQSCAANRTSKMANIWMHNGFLQVEGEKMSKSLGNFFTINELLQDWPGPVLRLSMLQTHYRQPIDWTAEKLQASTRELEKWFFEIDEVFGEDIGVSSAQLPASTELIESLNDDLNTPKAITFLRQQLSNCEGDPNKLISFLCNCEFLGILYRNKIGLLSGEYSGETSTEIMMDTFELYQGYRAKIYNEIPGALVEFEKKIHELDAEVTYKANGAIHLIEDSSDDTIQRLINERNAARKGKNWAEADRIRDELAAMGIALKDAKDPETGEIVTTWEIAR